MTSLLPGPVGLWISALDALEVRAAREQVVGGDTFTAPAQDWARLAPAVASLR